MKSFLTAVALSAISFASQASLLEYTSSNGTTFREAGYTPGTFFSAVASDTVVNNISVLNDLNSNGDLKFLIFAHETHELLFSSSAKSFVDDGLSWKTSNSFSFTLQAGHQYDIGAIANVGSSWSYDCCNGTYTQNGLTISGENANFSNFDAPFQSGHAATIIPIKLNVAAVPEPETLALTLAGLAIVGGVARRRK